VAVAGNAIEGLIAYAVDFTRDDMTNLIMLFVCLFAGLLLRRVGRLPDNAHATINGFIVHIALPALILGQIHGLRLTPDLLWPVLMPWMLWWQSKLTWTSGDTKSVQVSST
jgi:predicted permease